MSKESLTGYLNRSYEAGKLENLIYVQIGSLYYLPDFGIDRRMFFDTTFEIQPESFSSYLRQMAMKNGIVTTSLKIVQQDFTSVLKYTLADSNQQTYSFGGFGGL